MTETVIAEWQKNSRETLRVRLDEYQGQRVIDCRAWYADKAGNLKPGRGGLTVSAGSGLVSGVFLWAGFILMPMITSHMYQRASRALTLIDGAHWLGVMALQGVVLGALAIR